MSENFKNIDLRLEDQAQRSVAKLVAGIPDEAPSMVWRSQLNEALLAVSTKQRRRRRFFLIARPALALVAVSAFAMVMFVKPGNVDSLPVAHQPVASAPLEASLFNIHRDDVRVMDVAGVGLDPNEPVVDSNSNASASSDDSEADSGALIRTFRLIVSIVSVVLCLAVPVAAQDRGEHGHDRDWMQSPNVPQVLKSAIVHGAHARYVGRRTVEFWRSVKDLKHDEIVSRDGERSRVEFPDGGKFPGRIYVENEHERREYHPEKNEVWVLPPRHEESLARLVRMASRGADGKVVFSTAPGTQVAGYQTMQVVVSDPQGNVNQRLYIEPGSGVLLKREVFDAGGAKIGMFEFTEVNLNPPPFDPSLFRIDRKNVRIVSTYDHLKDVAAQEHFQAASLPPSSGFRLDGARATKIQGEQVLVESYSSHQGRLSLFELRSDLNPDRLHQFERDELHAYSWRVGQFTYVLVGNLDVSSLSRLSQQVSGTR